MASPTGTQAVDRALRLLTIVMESPRAISFGDLQEMSGLAKSTLSRLLSSLENAGLISRNSQGGVRAGSALTRFAYSHLPNEELIDFAGPSMDALGQATGETINLAVLVGDEVEQISQVDCTFHIGGVNWGVSRVPLHCSALGKVFLAHGTAIPEGRLARLTPRSITNRKVLEAELEGTRTRGWSLADSELEVGLIAIAAPIFIETGQIIGALSISGPTMRMTREVTMEYADLLLEQAALVSEKFGFLMAPNSEVPATPDQVLDHNATDHNATKNPLVSQQSPARQSEQDRRRVGAA